MSADRDFWWIQMMPEGEYNVEEIEIRTKEGTSFTLTDRDVENKRDDGEMMIFKNLSVNNEK